MDISFIIIAVVIFIFICLLAFILPKQDKTRNALKDKLTAMNARQKVLWAIDGDSEALREFALEEKGMAYEFQVGKYLTSLGYSVVYNGIKRGINDGGIDIIATKKTPLQDEKVATDLILAQCKNYYDISEIDQNVVRKFLGDCYVYLRWKGLFWKPKTTITHLFITSKPFEENGSVKRYEKYCQENRNFNLKLQVLEYDEKTALSDEYAEVMKDYYENKYKAEFDKINKVISA